MAKATFVAVYWGDTDYDSSHDHLRIRVRGCLAARSPYQSDYGITIGSDSREASRLFIRGCRKHVFASLWSEKLSQTRLVVFVDDKYGTI